MSDMNNIPWNEMSVMAWAVRENSFLFGKTKVGAVVCSAGNNLFAGCNVEHKYRCHDVHAEVNALSNMISHGETKIKAVLIVADREFFTPCGGCMDWIMQHGEDDCQIGFQNLTNEEIKIFRSSELMPYYPK